MFTLQESAGKVGPEAYNLNLSASSYVQETQVSVGFLFRLRDLNWGN